MGINADLKIQQLACLLITLRIKSSLVILVSKAVHDGASPTLHATILFCLFFQLCASCSFYLEDSFLSSLPD